MLHQQLDDASNFHQVFFCQDEILIHLRQYRKLPHDNLIAGNTCDGCIFINSRPKSLPATVESSILLPWVKGDSIEAEAISCPPIALLSKPSISVKEKGQGFFFFFLKNTPVKNKWLPPYSFSSQQTVMGSVMYQVCSNLLSEY